MRGRCKMRASPAAARRCRKIAGNTCVCGARWSAALSRKSGPAERASEEILPPSPWWQLTDESAERQRISRDACDAISRINHPATISTEGMTLTGIRNALVSRAGGCDSAKESRRAVRAGAGRGPQAAEGGFSPGAPAAAGFDPRPQRGWMDHRDDLQTAA